MARARLLKPGFFTNAKLSELHPHGRLLFAGLWTIADREGRLVDEPRWIKGQIFPYETVNVDKYLNQLAERDFIIRYESGGQRLIQIVKFLQHQTPHVREVPSTIPAPVQHSASPALGEASPAVSVSVPVPIAVAVRVTGNGDAPGPRTPSPVGVTDWDFALSLYSTNVAPRCKDLDVKARNELRGFYDRLPHDWVFAAINETATCKDPGFGYVKTILEACETEGRPPSSLGKTRKQPIPAQGR